MSSLADFEYDPVKSAANKQKHGIDFEEAQRLWEQPVLELASRFKDEPRRMVIGTLGDRFWTAIVTNRHGRIRLISVRRSRANEEELYKTLQEDNDQEP